MDKHPRRKAIRITLHYGLHSNADLVRILSNLDPYKRAKFVRQLVDDGLRVRLGEKPTPGAVLAPHPESASSVVIDSQPPEDEFSESVLDQIGKTVQ